MHQIKTGLCATMGLLLFLAACNDDNDMGADLGPDLAESDALSDTQADGPALAQLRSYDPTCTDFAGLVPNYVSASNHEFGHWAGVHLTPSSYPFTVQKVRYALNAIDPNCDMGLAHKVEIYKNSSGTPDATPQVVSSINQPADAALSAKPRGNAVQWREVSLATPVTLTAGEHLYVDIEMVGNVTTAARLCLGMTDSATSGKSECAGTAGQNFWSQAASPPYTWVELSTWNISGNLLLVALRQ